MLVIYFAILAICVPVVWSGITDFTAWTYGNVGSVLQAAHERMRVPAVTTLGLLLNYAIIAAFVVPFVTALAVTYFTCVAVACLALSKLTEKPFFEFWPDWNSR